MDPLTLFIVGTSIAGAGMGIAGDRRSAAMAKAIGRMRYQSAQQYSKQIIASGQRMMFEEQRQADLVASRAIAVAAAGGGNPDDMSVSKIVWDIKGEGAYRAAVAMYEAESQADQVMYEGKMAAITGSQEASAYNRQSMGRLLDFAGETAVNKKLGVYG